MAQQDRKVLRVRKVSKASQALRGLLGHKELQGLRVRRGLLATSEQRVRKVSKVLQGLLARKVSKGLQVHKALMVGQCTRAPRPQALVWVLMAILTSTPPRLRFTLLKPQVPGQLAFR